MVKTRLLALLVAMVVVVGLGPSAPAGAAAPPAKSFTLTVSPARPVWSQSVKIAASIVPKGGGAPQGGTVTFYADGALLGTATATKRITTLTTTGLPPDVPTLTATYSGDARTAAGSATPLTIAVDPAPTTTTLRATANPAPAGEPVELRATVVTAAPGAPSRKPAGRVLFQTTGRQVYVRLNANGIAVWRPRLPNGSYRVTASYEPDLGDRRHAPSGAGPIDLRVGTSTPDLQYLAEPGEFVRVVSATQATAQQITPTRTGLLDQVRLGLGWSAPSYTDVDDLEVTIQTVTPEGLPTGTVIGSGRVRSQDTPGQLGLVDVGLTSPASVTAGTMYALVLSMPTGARRGWTYVTSSGDAYPGHVRLSDHTGSWTEQTEDLYFQTWVL